MRTVFLLIAILSMVRGHSQTKEDWEQTVNWDGVSHWSKYIQTQPKYMGPNALPVPLLGNGSLDNANSLAMTGSLHFLKGDNTQNFTLYGNYSLVKDVLSFDFMYVPIETFNTSEEIKKERRVLYTHYYDQYASGDVILNTNIRLLRKLEKTLQLTLRIGYRFPSSRDLKSARYTDGPGYNFDITFGRSLTPSLKVIGMAGFYCWQMTGEKYRQNDAFLFGSGIEWNKKGWKLQGYSAGYLGYIENSGDKPILLRATAEKKKNNTAVLIRLQKGIHDFRYSTFEAGLRYFIAEKKTKQAN